MLIDQLVPFVSSNGKKNRHFVLCLRITAADAVSSERTESRRNERRLLVDWCVGQLRVVVLSDAAMNAFDAIMLSGLVGAKQAIS